MQKLVSGPGARTRRVAPPAGLLLALLAGSLTPAWGQQSPVEPATAPQPRPPELAPPPPQPPRPEIEAPAGPIADGPEYEVSSFILRYATTNPDQPPLEAFLGAKVLLAQRDGVYVAAREGLPSVTLTLAELTRPQPSRRVFSASAINAISARIVQALNDLGLIGVLVVPDRGQIDPESLADLRPQELRTLTLNIWTRTVGEVRTLGSGERFARPTARGDQPSQETRINHRVHRRIRELSPMQPGAEGVPGDVLQRDVLDEYLYRLNRHPGRRVDAAISAGDSPGEITLDYIVTENKPWMVYFQVSNTGTEETDDWRQRLGFVHYQLTGRDDIFSIDYITAGFEDTHAVLASYEAPFATSQVLRFRAYGSWSEFTASDVGFEGEDFSGDSWSAGGELILNIFQRGPAFLDLFGGARWQHINVINEPVDVEGEDDFFIPYIGLRFQRDRIISNTLAEVRLETNLADVAGTDSSEVERLGRLRADDEWTVLKWRANHSFFLEPIMRRTRRTALAHEVSLSFSGQHALDNRLIPQEQEVIGGLYTVRGYEEAVAAGDNVYLGSAEYRFHLPRWLSPREPGRAFGRPFRWAPSEPYGRPDWDLILKAFVDAGRATNNDRQRFEEDETLLGAGVGVEVQLWRNINLRADWGFALKDARDVDAGDNRLHFVATLLY